MTTGFYRRLAWTNIKKDRRFFIPHILTGTGLLAAFYIVLTITLDERLRNVKGGDYLPAFMGIGTAVMALLSIILIFYTNSFLMRQRKREYGMYNVLGMEKRHVGRVMFHETVISGIISIVLGTLFGILLYKLCSLLICEIFQSEIVMGFYFITLKSIIPSVLFFALLYIITFAVNMLGIMRMRPAELLSSRSVGEREPKVKWLILILGAVSLGAGYWIAVSVKSPLSAILLFFAAVFLVIIGTYFLFTAGSIFVLKMLKKSKKYYYKKRHFQSVSGLLYRMKQNAVGLASICILATGVLVMISSTTSLYSGMQDTLNKNYPQELYLTASYTVEDGTEVFMDAGTLTQITEKAADDENTGISYIISQKYLSVAFNVQDNRLLCSRNADDVNFYSKIADFCFITNDVYKSLTGNSLELEGNDIYICNQMLQLNTRISDYLLAGDIRYNIIGELAAFPIDVAAYGVVVADETALNGIYRYQKDEYGQYASEFTERIAVKFDSREEAGETDVIENIQSGIIDYMESQKDRIGGYMYYTDNYWNAKESVIGMYGTFLFLGIILGTVCMFATVLIIYYKQISEGYEDRERYQIMKKVGMSDKEIKGTIKTQTLLVFFLPLVTAGIHMAFAFPMIEKLLCLLMLSNTSLFVVSTLVTYAVFTLVYILIYLGTARTYYKIVH